MAPLGEAALGAKRGKEAPENMCAHSQRHQAEAPETESEQRRRQKRAERHHKEPPGTDMYARRRVGGASERHQKEPRAAFYMGVSLFKSLERLSGEASQRHPKARPRAPRAASRFHPNETRPAPPSPPAAAATNRLEGRARRGHRGGPFTLLPRPPPPPPPPSPRGLGRGADTGAGSLPSYPAPLPIHTPVFPRR